MRTKTGQRLGALGVIVASTALAGFAQGANASEGRRHRGPSARQPVVDATHAGTLRIGSHRFALRNYTFVRDEIAARFRRLGYQAWGANEKVYVRVGRRHRPSVGWSSGTHRVVTWYEGDCLVMKVIPPTPARVVVEVCPPQPVWRPGRIHVQKTWRAPRGRRGANGRW
ncbi:MAG: hypothetical protein ACIARR_02320 [Phycisphaerales bacterium JB059]